MSTQGRSARAKHAAQTSLVIDIGSSPEPCEYTKSASNARATVAQTNVKGKGKAKSKSNTRSGRMIMGPVIELADSDSDSEQRPSVPNSHSYHNDQPQAGPSRPKPFPMAIPQRSNSTLTSSPAASSLENISIASGSGLQKKRKVATTSTSYLPSKSDEENDPPVVDDDAVPHKKVKLAEQNIVGQTADNEWDPEMQPYLLQFYEERRGSRKAPNSPSSNTRATVTPPVAHAHAEQTVAPVPRPNPVPPAPVPIQAEPEPESNEDPIARTVAQIIEIIPDVEPNYLRGLVETHLPNFGVQTTEHVLGLLFETEEFPRVDKSKGKRKAVENGVAEDSGDRHQKKIKIDYASINRESGSRVYYELALIHLQISFPFIPKSFLRRTLEKYKCLYVPTHLALSGFGKPHTDARGDPQSFLPYTPKTTRYNPVKDLRTVKAFSDQAFTEERRWLLEHLQDPNETKVGIVGAATSDLLQQTSGKGKEKATEEEEDTPLEDGTGIECQCCFSEYAFDKMVQCPETHLFCSNCVSQYAATKLGEHNPSILCMHASGCTLPFTESELRRVLSPKLMGLYERVKQQKEIEEAGLEGLEECPFCEWKCVLEASNEEEKLFRCGNEEGGCGVVSCRSCKKKDHLPKSCKEVEEDKVLDGRHAIEEAMTRALMRNCPKCQKAFVKEAGCNKMTCPNCRTLSCYVCRQVISGYQHFDQTQPGQPTTSRAGGKCRLWDNVDERHANEVRAAAEKAAEEYKRDHPDVNEEGIKVDFPTVPPPAPPTIAGHRVLHPPRAMVGPMPPIPPAYALPQFAALPMQEARDVRDQRQQELQQRQQILVNAHQQFVVQHPQHPQPPRRPARPTRAQVRQQLHQQLQQAEVHRLEQQRLQEQQRLELQIQQQQQEQYALQQQRALLARQQAERVQEQVRLNAEFARRMEAERQLQVQQQLARQAQARERPIVQMAANVRLNTQLPHVQQHRANQHQQMVAARQLAMPIVMPANFEPGHNRVYEDALGRFNANMARRR